MYMLTPLQQLVDFRVCLCGHTPAEVAAHSRAHQVLPVCGMVLVQIQSRFDRVEEQTGIVRLEHKPVARTRPAVADRIAQPPCLAHDGDGAVAAGDHLGQAAGFALGGHEHDVCTGVDQSRDFRVIGDVYSHIVRILEGFIGEETLIGIVSCAEEYELDVLL